MFPPIQLQLVPVAGEETHMLEGENQPIEEEEDQYGEEDEGVEGGKLVLADDSGSST